MKNEGHEGLIVNGDSQTSKMETTPGRSFDGNSFFLRTLLGGGAAGAGLAAAAMRGGDSSLNKPQRSMSRTGRKDRTRSTRVGDDADTETTVSNVSDEETSSARDFSSHGLPAPSASNSPAPPNSPPRTLHVDTASIWSDPSNLGGAAASGIGSNNLETCIPMPDLKELPVVPSPSSVALESSGDARDLEDILRSTCLQSATLVEQEEPVVEIPPFPGAIPSSAAGSGRLLLDNYSSSDQSTGLSSTRNTTTVRNGGVIDEILANRGNPSASSHLQHVSRLFENEPCCGSNAASPSLGLGKKELEVASGIVAEQLSATPVAVLDPTSEDSSLPAARPQLPLIPEADIVLLGDFAGNSEPPTRGTALYQTQRQVYAGTKFEDQQLDALRTDLFGNLCTVWQPLNEEKSKATAMTLKGGIPCRVATRKEFMLDFCWSGTAMRIPECDILLLDDNAPPTTRATQIYLQEREFYHHAGAASLVRDDAQHILQRVHQRLLASRLRRIKLGGAGEAIEFPRVWRMATHNMEQALFQGTDQRTLGVYTSKQHESRPRKCVLAGLDDVLEDIQTVGGMGGATERSHAKGSDTPKRGGGRKWHLNASRNKDQQRQRLFQVSGPPDVSLPQLQQVRNQFVGHDQIKARYFAIFDLEMQQVQAKLTSYKRALAGDCHHHDTVELNRLRESFPRPAGGGEPLDEDLFELFLEQQVHQIEVGVANTLNRLGNNAVELYLQRHPSNGTTCNEGNRGSDDAASDSKSRCAASARSTPNLLPALDGSLDHRDSVLGGLGMATSSRHSKFFPSSTTGGNCSGGEEEALSPPDWRQIMAQHSKDGSGSKSSNRTSRSPTEALLASHLHQSLHWGNELSAVGSLSDGPRSPRSEASAKQKDAETRQPASPALSPSFVVDNIAASGLSSQQHRLTTAFKYGEVPEERQQQDEASSGKQQQKQPSRLTREQLRERMALKSRFAPPYNGLHPQAIAAGAVAHHVPNQPLPPTVQTTNSSGIPQGSSLRPAYPGHAAVTTPPAHQATGMYYHTHHHHHPHQMPTPPEYNGQAQPGVAGPCFASGAPGAPIMACHPGPPISMTKNGFGGPQKGKLFVFHIPPYFTNVDLYNLFRNYGNLLSAFILVDPQTQRGKGYAFVTYDCPLAAARAMQALHGFEIGGKRLRVELRGKTRNKGARRGGGSASEDDCFEARSDLEEEEYAGQPYYAAAVASMNC